LHGAADGRAAYVLGAVLHVVRFADSTDRAYWIDGLVPPIHAALSPAGLYIGANSTTASPPGLVGYVPIDDLAR
jgi:hypothetical protein